MRISIAELVFADKNATHGIDLAVIHIVLPQRVQKVIAPTYDFLVSAIHQLDSKITDSHQIIETQRQRSRVQLLERALYRGLYSEDARRFFAEAFPDFPALWQLALVQYILSLLLGVFCVSQVHAIALACTMKTLDNRGLSAMLSLLLMTFSGNVVPLTLFPDSFQQLIRYQPFAQVLDAPIRMYQSCASLPEWALNVAVQAGWILILRWVSRAMWQKRLDNMIVQRG